MTTSEDPRGEGGALERALGIALRAHRGQRDKAGRPYILHPLRVMLELERSGADDAVLAAALLHDVIEDSDVSPNELRAAGLPERALEAVAVLTKARGDPYGDYLERVAANEIARRVKLADLRDNLRVERLPEVADRDLERLNKYLRAVERLNGGAARPRDEPSE